MSNRKPRGRKPKPVDDYKSEILDLLQTKHYTRDAIIAWLQENKDLTIDRNTLQRRLKKWGATSQDFHTKDSEELRERITFMFNKQLASDEVILATLREEGFTITSRGLVRIRKDLGLLRVLPLLPSQKALGPLPT